MKAIRARRRRQFWTEADIAYVRQHYARSSTQAIAAELGRTDLGIYQLSQKLGLAKDPEFVTAQNRALGRALREAGRPHRFPKGHVPANKGARRPGWHRGRMQETQFKKGQRPHTWKPIGTIVVNVDGYLVRKVTDTGYAPRDWVGVHRLVWIEANGPIPPGHIIRFREGRHTTDVDKITPDALECITRKENARRNHFKTIYPPDVAQLIVLKGAIRRQIRKREKNAAHDRRTEEPPVRHLESVEGSGQTNGDRPRPRYRRDRERARRNREGRSEGDGSGGGQRDGVLSGPASESARSDGSGRDTTSAATRG